MMDADTSTATQTDAAEIDVEEIMQEIRQQILAKKESLRSTSTVPIPVGGERLPAAFYEHLYRAGLMYDEIDAKLYVTKSKIPLIGPLLDKVRYKAHELVLFYVNQVATDQMRFNEQILHAVSLLAREMEEEAESSVEHSTGISGEDSGNAQ